jgi:uncharacterized protein YuzE
MQLKSDEGVDALYVYFTQEPVTRTERVSDRANVDYDAGGQIVGVEILDPSDGVRLRDLPRSEDIGRLLARMKFPIYA